MLIIDIQVNPIKLEFIVPIIQNILVIQLIIPKWFFQFFQNILIMQLRSKAQT